MVRKVKVTRIESGTIIVESGPTNVAGELTGGTKVKTGEC